MKKLRSTHVLLVLLVAMLSLQACKKPKKDTDTTPVVDDQTLKSKVYILNEGNFNSGNASVSLYDRTFNKVYNDLFSSANNRPIGDVLQSMCLVNDKAYFVVNNSNKIEITNTFPLLSTGTISNLALPRYMVAVNSNKAYVTEYVSYAGNGRISIIDLTNNNVTSTIPLGYLPEAMILVDGKMYVTISGEDKVTVINTTTDLVESSITVTSSPSNIVKDANGKLWVLCAGYTDYVTPSNSTPGALVKINPANGTVENTLAFSDVNGSPFRLAINGSGNTLYYGYENAVYQQSITATSLSSTPLINRNFYGLGVDPVSGNVYVGSYGFSSNQYMIRYNSNGNLIDSTQVGVGPNGFVFVN
ncbi:MAG TPA: DUF5074 domain-containing protein [Cytophagaceae bacterium]|nr:DUF5074 domain-containing protein [Cytophagaceae bacterium]